MKAKTLGEQKRYYLHEIGSRNLSTIGLQRKRAIDKLGRITERDGKKYEIMEYITVNDPSFVEHQYDSYRVIASHSNQRVGKILHGDNLNEVKL